MQEFWFCEACKSMNRGDADRCYRCRAPKTQATMATVVKRQPGVVVAPGLDDEHREIAWTLMLRQTYVSAWKLGYLAAALLFLVIAVGACVVAIEIALMVSRGSPAPIDPREARSPLLLMALLALLLTGICAAVVHSVFLCLTSMDAPALGSGSPRFDPIRAGLWWIESWLWAIRAGLAFIGPPLLCLFAVSIGGLIFGLVLGLVWFVCAFWVFGDPITSLAKPGRLLKDLWDRLAVPGSSSSRIVTLWSAAWGTARGFDFAVAALTYMAIVVLAITAFAASRLDVSIGGSSTDDVTWLAILLVDLVAAVQCIADGIALYLLAQITIDLSRRQRIREEWVLGGLSDASARAATQGSAVLTSATHGPVFPPQPQPQPNFAPPEPVPPSQPSAVTPPPDELPADSRTFERSVAQPSFEPLPLEELPSAWSRAIQEATPPNPSAPAPGGQSGSQQAPPPPEPEPDRPVIRPSRQDFSRYRAPQGDVKADRPVEGPPDDLDLGGGI